MPQHITRPGSLWDTGHTSVPHQMIRDHVATTWADNARTRALARYALATYTVCHPIPGPGCLVDLSGQVHDTIHAVGLVKGDHCVALTASIRGQHVRCQETGGGIEHGRAVE